MKITIDLADLLSFRSLSPMLYKVFDDLCGSWPDGSMRITSIARTASQDAAMGASGIHSSGPPWRAIDVAVNGLAQDDIDEICSKINQRWQYDAARPTMVVAYGKPHGTGPHIHLQVGPNTHSKDPDPRSRA